jgi:hypothetical protein
MAKVTRRDPYPGETCFGGGSGILILDYALQSQSDVFFQETVDSNQAEGKGTRWALSD